jgi:hypothetical protein
LILKLLFIILILILILILVLVLFLFLFFFEVMIVIEGIIFHILNFNIEFLSIPKYLYMMNFNSNLYYILYLGFPKFDKKLIKY